MCSPPALVGIVLAAGKSSRMGSPKALLRCPPGGDTFVSRIVRTLHAAGLLQVVVIGRDSDHALRHEVAAVVPAAVFLANPAPELGQLSSLLIGIEHAERAGAAGAVVLPVDTPLVLASTVAAVIGAFNTGAAPIVRATHQGRHGHPVIFAARLFQELRAADLAVGARAVVREDVTRVLNVDVDDAGVIRDVDVPEDYRRLLDREP